MTGWIVAAFVYLLGGIAVWCALYQDEDDPGDVPHFGWLTFLWLPLFLFAAVKAYFEVRQDG